MCEPGFLSGSPQHKRQEGAQRPDTALVIPQMQHQLRDRPIDCKRVLTTQPALCQLWLRLRARTSATMHAHLSAVATEPEQSQILLHALLRSLDLLVPAENLLLGNLHLLDPTEHLSILPQQHFHLRLQSVAGACSAYTYTNKLRQIEDENQAAS